MNMNILSKFINLRNVISMFTDFLFSDKITNDDIDNIRVKNLIEYKRKAKKKLNDINKKIQKEYDDKKKKIDLEYEEEKNKINRLNLFLKKLKLDIEEKKEKINLLIIKKDFNNAVDSVVEYKKNDTEMTKLLKSKVKDKKDEHENN